MLFYAQQMESNHECMLFFVCCVLVGFLWYVSGNQLSGIASIIRLIQSLINIESYFKC